MADVEACLLAHLNSGGEVPDSRSYASSLRVTHDELEAVIKSLSAFRIVDTTVLLLPSPPLASPSPNLSPGLPNPNELSAPQDITKETWVLTDEAKGYVAGGSPEAQLVAAIPPEGASKDVLRVRYILFFFPRIFFMFSWID